MFYSHEILTSRKYGVATVWLVATLGSKSTAKKVNKKAILDVNVKKACQTIIEPEAPMALRLQSNLLYGLSRVYEQQCGYVLHDAQAAQLKMRELMKLVRNNDLNSSAQARPDQLMLMDDIEFLPEMMALPALDFDFSNLALEPAGNSQRSSQSMLSIRHRSSSISSHDDTLIGLNIPSSSTQAGAYQLPFDDPLGGPSLQKATAGRPHDDEEGFIYDDSLDFEFDADGMMRDITADEKAARRAVNLLPSGQGRLESESAASGRVRKEHDDATTGRVLPILDDEGVFNVVDYGADDGMMLPDAEPFPMMASGLGGSDRPNPLLAKEDKVVSEEASSDTAEAPAKRRKPKAKKVAAMDQSTELRNSDLIVWNSDYLKHMASATQAHNQKKGTAQAKKNAEAFVFGNGINGVGQGICSFKLSSPLAIFSGAALLAQVTGKPITEPRTKGKKGTKRDSPNGAEEDETPTSKRARQDAPIMLDEMGRGTFDDDMIMHDFSSGVEIGREAPDALADYPFSAMLPWNVSASVGSYQRGASSSIQGGRGIPGSISKRLTSASPLVGHGSNMPGEMDHFSSQIDDGMVMYGRSDNEESEVARSKRSESLANGVRSSQADFEIFGAAAQVDTQTAASSQWVKEALDKESNNFFEYVRNTIHEKGDDELSDSLIGPGEEAVRKDKSVTFEELFDPNQNSAMVAAQAFYHVLSLATKKRVWVEQEINEESLAPFGEIRIGVAA